MKLVQRTTSSRTVAVRASRSPDCQKHLLKVLIDTMMIATSVAALESSFAATCVRTNCRHTMRDEALCGNVSARYLIPFAGPLAFHPRCVKLRGIPEGSWICPECQLEKCGSCGKGPIPPGQDVLCGNGMCRYFCVNTISGDDKTAYLSCR